MLKQFFVLLIVMSMLWGSVSAEESTNKLIEMPEGFEGIYLGMSIKELLKIRPEANVDPMDRYSPSQELDTTKLNQSIDELVKKDPLYELTMAGLYTFRDGRLKNAMLIWGGDMGKIRKYRATFVSSISKRWGDSFQRKILKQGPGTKEEHLVPLLLWHKGNTMIAATCTSEYDDMTLKKGAFMISLFSKDDKEVMSIFAGEKVDKNVRDKLFRRIGIAP